MPGQGFIFFERNFADITRLDIGEITLSIDNNDSEKTNLIDRNRFTKWTSVGADNDSTTVTLTVDFMVNRDITDLILVNTNLKDFELEYWDGGGWVNVFSETTNADSVYRATFATINTDMVRLIMNTTIVADSEKEIQLFIITDQIGQIEYRPLARPRHESNIVENKMITGKSRLVLNEIQYKFTINFEGYTNVNDRQLLLDLSNKFDSFLFWPSGGDESQFSFADDGYRLEDIYLVAIENRARPFYSKNYYKAGTNASLNLIEVS